MINILTPDVYNRIAAGEVVDRPYSVVKELVENAVDAGASEITIEIEGGGKQRIRVTDNGGGIEKSDLKNAFLPHATSKLKTAEDLEAIATLGFRGEAIASIASVSHMNVTSKTVSGEAWSLSSDGGRLGEITPAGGANGTCVSVDGLFYNTPARLKFLKSDAQEESDVTNMVARFILSRPEIAFAYIVKGKVRYRSFGDGLKSALAVVYGAGVLENCYELNADKHGIRLSGFIGNQNFSKPNRSYQSLFVNGRYVINQTVSSAIMNAYQNYLMKRQYPFYVLFLEVPPEIVDVNVHPNKADVRFADNQIIYGSVYSVVSAVLDGNSRALEYLAAVPSETENTAATQKPTVTQGKKTYEQAKKELQFDIPPMMQEKMTYEQAKKELQFDIPAMQGKKTCEQAKKELEFEILPVMQEKMTYEQAKKELQFDIPPVSRNVPRFGRGQKDFLEVRSPQSPLMNEPPKEDFFEQNRRELLAKENKAKQEKLDPAALVYKGELFQTYLIYEIGDEAYLVDQHAAHERLLYERLKERLEKREALSQPVLLPYILNINAQEYAFIIKNLEILRSFGFEIEDFGGTSLKISAVPVDLFGMNVESFFAEVLSSMESLRAIKLADILKDKLATMACKAAVKGGEKLTDGEVRSLMNEMEGDMGIKCPHGRPACVKIKKSELEKLFKRIV